MFKAFVILSTLIACVSTCGFVQGIIMFIAIDFFLAIVFVAIAAALSGTK